MQSAPEPLYSQAIPPLIKPGARYRLDDSEPVVVVTPAHEAMILDRRWYIGAKDDAGTAPSGVNQMYAGWAHPGMYYLIPEEDLPVYGATLDAGGYRVVTEEQTAVAAVASALEGLSVAGAPTVEVENEDMPTPLTYASLVQRFEEFTAEMSEIITEQDMRITTLESRLIDAAAALDPDDDPPEVEVRIPDTHGCG